MLKCKQVVEQAEALVDYTGLSRRERWALRMHLMMCRHCRRYVRQLRALLGILPREEEEAQDQQVKAVLAQLDNHSH